MKRSFQALSPQEALHVAVFIEERNAELYHHFAEMFASFQDFASLEIAGVLWDMALEERHHSSMLQARYTAQYGHSACALTEADVLEMIELPQLKGSEIFDSTAVTARQNALRLALGAETQAREFYAELARCVAEPDFQRVCEELASFEADHVEALTRRLEECGACGEPGKDLLSE